MSEKYAGEAEKLLILWASADREVALKMVFMYARNAKHNNWWNVVKLLVWGPSARLLAEDVELHSYLHEMKDISIEIIACKACADRYGVSDKLEDLGIEVKYMGEPLTEMLKSDWKVLTI